MKEDIKKIKDSISRYLKKEDAKDKGLLKDILSIIEENEKKILELKKLLEASLDFSISLFVWMINKLKETDNVIFFLERFEDGCELAILLSRVKGMEGIRKAIIEGKGKLGKLFRKRNLVLKDLVNKLLIYRKFYDKEDTKNMIKSLKKILKLLKKKRKWYDEKKFKKGSKHIKELKKIVNLLEDEKEIEKFLKNLLDLLKEYYKAKKNFHGKIKWVIKKGRLLNKINKVKRKKISTKTELIVLGRIRKYRVKVLLSLKKFKKSLKRQLKKIKDAKLKNKELKKKFSEVLIAKNFLNKFLDKTLSYIEGIRISEIEGKEEKEEEKLMKEISSDIMEIMISIYEISKEIKEVFKVKEMKKLIKVSVNEMEAYEALNKIMEKYKERIEKINEKIREILSKIDKNREFIKKSTDKERLKGIKEFVKSIKKEINNEKKSILSEKKAQYKIYRKMLLKILSKLLKKKVDIKKDYKRLKEEIKEIKRVSKASEKMVEEVEKIIIESKEDFLNEVKKFSKDILEFLDALKEMLEDMLDTGDIKAEYGESLFSGFLEYLLSYEEGLRTRFKNVLRKISKMIKLNEEELDEALKSYLEKIENIKLEIPEEKKSPDSYKIIAKASEGITRLLEEETKSAEKLVKSMLEILNNSKILGEEIKENKEIIKETIKNMAILSKVIKKLFKVKRKKRRKIKLPKISIPLFR